MATLQVKYLKITFMNWTLVLMPCLLGLILLNNIVSLVHTTILITVHSIVNLLILHRIILISIGRVRLKLLSKVLDLLVAICHHLILKIWIHIRISTIHVLYWRIWVLWVASIRIVTLLILEVHILHLIIGIHIHLSTD